jgi:hypothetical protein
MACRIEYVIFRFVGHMTASLYVVIYPKTTDTDAILSSAIKTKMTQGKWFPFHPHTVPIYSSAFSSSMQATATAAPSNELSIVEVNSNDPTLPPVISTSILR